MDFNETMNKLIQSAKVPILRFPATIGFLTALTIQLIYCIITDKEPDALTFFLCVGIPLTLVYHISSEDQPARHRQKAMIVLAVAIAALAADSIALHKTEEITASVTLAQAAAILALVIALCFLPFYREKDDRKSWNFVFEMICGAAVSYTVGGIMAGGLSFLYYSTCELFGATGSSKVFMSILAVCLVTIPVLLFLIRIPSGEKKHNAHKPENRFILGTARYLFIPLILLYLTILYMYGAMILFTWTLPRGMVASLVSTLMLGTIALTFLLYPFLNDTQHKGYEKFVMRWILPATLPLILLMSIALGRRLMDYGITANRLYMLTLNIWFYAVAIGLWTCKARRIHWISISFAAILIATSCHPYNFIRISHTAINSRLEALLATYPIKRNIQSDALRRHFMSIPESMARLQYQAMKDCRDSDSKFYYELLGDNSPFLYGDYDNFMKFTENNDNTANTKEKTMDKLSLSAVNHIAIICSDYKTSLAFYQDILGMTLISEENRKERSSMMAKLSMNGQYLIELFTFPNSPERPSYPEACGLRHLAFSVADLDATFSFLTAKGIECEPIRTAADGERCFFIHDPDGLPIEFVEMR